MDKNKIAAFFDERAHIWDVEQIRNDEVINIILDKGGIKKGVKVLDVASGTGVLFEDYERRGVSRLTGVDISPEMLKIAKEKYPLAELICADAETYSFEDKYGCIMIYNAFPHFPNPDMLFRNLSSALSEKGRLTVAHGMSMQDIEKCHNGAARAVSLSLPPAEELAEVMGKYVEVDIVVSDSRMYMVSGVKKQ